MLISFWQEVISRVLYFFRDMHTESTGVSWMRVCGTVTISTILIVFLAHNIAALIRGEGYQDFGVESVGVIFVILGAKVMQRKTELGIGGQIIELDDTSTNNTSKKSK